MSLSWIVELNTLYIRCTIPCTFKAIKNNIHLLPSSQGRHEFSGWNKSLCLPTNSAINCLLYRKLKHDVIQCRALCCETWQWDMTSGGRHDDSSSLHVTSLNQSYFFIRHINYMRYNNWECVKGGSIRITSYPWDHKRSTVHPLLYTSYSAQKRTLRRSLRSSQLPFL